MSELTKALLGTYGMGVLLTWMALVFPLEGIVVALGYALLWPLSLAYGLLIALRVAVRHAVATWRTV